MRSVGCGAIGCAAIVLLAWAAPVLGDRAKRAEVEFRRGLELLERHTIDTRRLAIRHLEQAALLDPQNPTFHLELGRAYFRAGFLSSARRRFERVAEIAPRDATCRSGLGAYWRRDWLKFLDPRSLARAVDEFRAATRLEPGRGDHWLELVPLLVERADLAGAAQAATRAVAEGGGLEAALAVAYTTYRLGQVGRADSLFAAILPHLPENVRERFEDIGPVATEQDTAALRQLEPAAGREFVRRFWQRSDPDLSTLENEAQLEYWSRVAHAYFLYYDRRRREWDQRGEVYVRYGSPATARYNPVGVSLADWAGSPRNVLIWEYPALGMRVELEDRLLSERYLLPISRAYDPDPRPDPEALGRNGNALATGAGRGVFPLLPPGAKPLVLAAAIARLETERGPLLLAQVESPGGPRDSLWAEWVVLDSTLSEAHRGARALSPSACGATELRVADFATVLRSGDYLVGLTVRDRHGRRGSFRAEVELETSRGSLALSDVVISCGTPVLPATGETPVVRIEPNPGSRVVGDEPLTAYFEIYHLRPGADGQSRFEYVYTVRSAEKDPRVWIQRLIAPRPAVPPLSVSRVEEQVGSLRRQFVSVPVRSLPTGRYEIEIRVRDLVAGKLAVRRAGFVKI